MMRKCICLVAAMVVVNVFAVESVKAPMMTQWGENALTVCVWDPSDSGAIGATGKQFIKPRACFYTRCSGILGTVWMETVARSYITDYRVTPDIEHGVVRFRVCANDWRETRYRVHIKVEPRIYYALCDTMGLMVLQDMPCDPPPNDGSQAPDNGFATDTIRYGFYRRDLKRVIDHLYNVPSIVMWIPYNESWGQPGEFLTHTTLDWVKAYDSSRLVDGPSGWNDYEGGNRRTTYADWHGWSGSQHKPAGACEAADVIDKHDYGKTPSVHPANDRRISFLGEFGGVNFKVKDHLWNPAGHFGYQQRESAQELEQAYVALIEQLCTRVPAGLSGFVYTQTTDVEIETNGLLTYDRKVLKFKPALLKTAHETIRAAVEK